MQSAASNDVNNVENEIEMPTMSNKRPFNEESYLNKRRGLLEK